MIFNFPSFGVGFLLGFGAGYASREISQQGIGIVRPISKSLVKVALRIGESARESLASLGETFEDILAEAQSETAPIRVKGGHTKAPVKRKPVGKSEGAHGAASTVH